MIIEKFKQAFFPKNSKKYSLAVEKGVKRRKYQNSRKRESNLPTGVSYRAANKKYISQFSLSSTKTEYLGLYDTPEEAVKARNLYIDIVFKN